MISHDHARSRAISVSGARPRGSARRATTAPSTTSTPRRCARWSARSWASRASWWWCRTTGASGAAGWTCRPRRLRTAPPSASLARRKAPASLLRPPQSFESASTFRPSQVAHRARQGRARQDLDWPGRRGDGGPTGRVRGGGLLLDPGRAQLTYAPLEARQLPLAQHHAPRRLNPLAPQRLPARVRSARARTQPT